MMLRIFRGLMVCAMLAPLSVAPLLARERGAKDKDAAAAPKEEAAKPDDAKKDDDKKADAKKDGSEIENDEISETKHTMVINGQAVEYIARAGKLIMKQEDGKKKASIFYVAYLKQGVADLAARPLTFSFNGGPGSSSVWLHLGVFGPRRVKFDDAGYATPPYCLVDNEYSLLDETDLVFIDPVSTGFSRAVPGEDPHQYHGVEEDIESIGEFIRLFVTRNSRWESPKFLAGESYGTTRAAGLVGHMQEAHGMDFNGVILVSAVLNFQTIGFDLGNDLPYIVFLPTYTATAWYHKKLPADLQADLPNTLREVEAFARGDYAAALWRGDALPADQRKIIVQKLAHYTGLAETYIEETNLRIQIGRFTKELDRDDRLTVGRFDSRYTGIDRDAAGEDKDYDPSYTAVQGAFTANLNHYLRDELKYESDLKYEILTGNVWPWSFNQYKNRYLYVGDTLREAMTRNPSLKVFIACGYYDLATPYYAAQYTVDHLGLEPGLRGNISMAYYPAGHMMYIHKPSLVQMKNDLAAYYHATLQK